MFGVHFACGYLPRENVAGEPLFKVYEILEINGYEINPGS